MVHPSINPPIPHDFLSYSAQLGKNPMLIQGPGGNTSFKQDHIMWIKASGMELADALNKNIFVPVDWEKALLEIEGHGDGTCQDAVIHSSSSSSSPLRPSIETTFHALLPHRYVIHTHSIHVLSHVVTRQGRNSLTKKLADLNWTRIPYEKPGIPLTKSIKEFIQKKRPKKIDDIYILENHGIILASDELSKVKMLVDQIEERLFLPQQETTLNLAPATSNHHIPGWKMEPKFSALMTDKSIRNKAINGSYYPDHVVFLGPGLPCINPEEVENYCAGRPEFPVVLVKSWGVFYQKTITPTQLKILQCLYDILSRIPHDDHLVPIGEEAEIQLLNWDAEKYRQKIKK